MKVKCDFCDNYFDENAANCPTCGAANNHVRRTSNDVPKTIEELKEWYKAHNLPSEDVTRFFIGKNYKGAKAFGIYKDGEEFVVYKNKDNGERAVRYQGKDEAYAVNELYMKLKETIAWQKDNNRKNKSASNNNFVKKPGLLARFFGNAWPYLLVGFIMVIACAIAFKSPGYGYYKYNNDLYYYHSDWYLYDDDEGWLTTEAPTELKENYDTYYESSSYTSEMDAEDITNTDWAESWDDDSDWDSGDSWSSDGGTDWSTDW